MERSCISSLLFLRCLLSPSPSTQSGSRVCIRCIVTGGPLNAFVCFLVQYRCRDHIHQLAAENFTLELEFSKLEKVHCRTIELSASFLTLFNVLKRISIYENTLSYLNVINVIYFQSFAFHPHLKHVRPSADNLSTRQVYTKLQLFS